MKKICTALAWIVAFLLIVLFFPRCAPVRKTVVVPTSPAKEEVAGFFAPEPGEVTTTVGGPWLRMWTFKLADGAPAQPTYFRLWKYDMATGKTRQGTWEQLIQIADASMCSTRTIRNGRTNTQAYLCYWHYEPVDKDFMHKVWGCNTAGCSAKPIPEPQLTCGGTPGSGCPCHLYASATGCTE